MKKVLMIAPYLPPISNVGSRRVLKFAKYLPYYGWKTIVLTKSTTYLWHKDWSLMEEIPRGLIVERAFYPDWIQILANFIKFLQRSLKFILKKRNKKFIFKQIEKETVAKKNSNLKEKLLKIVNIYKSFAYKYLLIPDEDIVWFPFALLKALKIIRREKINVIYSTAPSFTCFLIGFFLKLITKKSWVADYRDLWVGGSGHIWTNKFRIKIEEIMEKICISIADEVISVSKPMVEYLYRHHGFTSKQIHFIPNGFDLEDFSGLQKNCNRNNSIFTITYTGNITGYRKATFFIKALGGLLNAEEFLRKQIAVRFIGRIAKDHIEEMEALIKAYDLNKIIKLEPLIPYREALRNQINSDVLLLIVGITQNIDGVLTTKLFEYLASGRPILALAPKCAARDLILQTRSGIVVEPEDIEGIKRAIWDLYQKYKKDELKINSDWEVIKQYDRKLLTEKLAKVFDGLFKDRNIEKKV